MKNCQLHQLPRPDLCVECSRDLANQPRRVEPIKLEIRDEDRGRLKFRPATKTCMASFEWAR